MEHGRAKLRQRYSNKNTNWKPGTFVWGQFKRRFWAAVVISHDEVGFKAAKPSKSWLFWFGDYRISEVYNKDISHFDADFLKVYNAEWNKMSANKKSGIIEAIREFGLPMTSAMNENELLAWAINGFLEKPNENVGISDLVHRKLQKIKNANKTDSERKETTSAKEKAVLRKISRGHESLDTICIACYSMQVDCEHPIFNGGLCSDCKVKLKNTYYVVGDDNVKYFCTICACRGNMVVCGSERCGKVYCKQCIDDLAYPGARTIILKKEPWLCFICHPKSMVHGLLSVREDWKSRIHLLFTHIAPYPAMTGPLIPLEKLPIRVLSLFDGIATGYTALNELNIDVKDYFASEINDDCIKVAEKNYGNKITFVGDIRQLTELDIKSMGPIDLLIGGSPCNDFSLVNPFRKGLYDPEGTGVLFFDFFRILNLLYIGNNKPFFWLFENVASMHPNCRSTISRFLKCEPTLIDAVWVSPQHRPRLFWGNLPTLQGQLYENDGPDLQKYLTSTRIANVKKLRTVTTSSASLRQGPSKDYPVTNERNMKDKINIEELEKVFGFPRNYTAVEGFSATTRQKLLGAAWSTQVTCLIFRCLQEYYLSK